MELAFHPRAPFKQTLADQDMIHRLLAGFGPAHRQSAMSAVRSRYCNHVPDSMPLTMSERVAIHHAMEKMPTFFKLIRTAESVVSVWRLLPRELQPGNDGVIAVREWDDASAMLKSYPPSIALALNIHELEGTAWVECDAEGNQIEKEHD